MSENLRGLSSAGRAPDLHSGGQEFDPPRLHHLPIVLTFCSGLNRPMKVCAITMVYQDYWALAQWVGHYANELGIQNLYIVSHGHDDEVRQIAKGANVWTIPRESLDAFDKRRNKMLNQFQSGLLQFYDWVIRTDADELVCVNPNMHGSITDLLSCTSQDSVFSIGLNVYEQAEEHEMPESTSVFDCRTAAVVTGNYSKAWAVRSDTALMRHGVRLVGDDNTQHTYAFPKDVFMCHLKFANVSELAEVNKTRKEIARSGEPGVPGWGWRRADAHTMKFFEMAETMPFMEWSDAMNLAYEKIPTNMKYNENDCVIRSPGIPFLAKTKLPPWFKVS